MLSDTRRQPSHRNDIGRSVRTQEPSQRERLSGGARRLFIFIVTIFDTIAVGRRPSVSV